ncbi:MAG TPA: nucleoside triphosphate pyrophosphatase [Candidatus Nanopelagicaceae bacterium]|nr:nucleoside triphosphate pyrophosphatase [Candidatus Nanopelagicaceae bacterium]
MKKIILASKSIDRSKILDRLNISFKILEININESDYKDQYSDPIDLVKELAKAKALKAKELLKSEEIGTIIIAADTIVEFDGKIIGKAQNEKEAFQILKSLTNRSHNLITGIALTSVNDSKVIVDYDITVVTFLDLSDDDIRNYIKTEEWKGRAGAYSIRDRASLFIKEIRGSPSNVMGLPMQKIFKILKTEFNLNLFEN